MRRNNRLSECTWNTHVNVHIWYFGGDSRACVRTCNGKNKIVWSGDWYFRYFNFRAVATIQIGELPPHPSYSSAVLSTTVNGNGGLTKATTAKETTSSAAAMEWVRCGGKRVENFADGYKCAIAAAEVGAESE